MIERPASIFDTRLCRIPGCPDELDSIAPADGPFVGMCASCRGGKTAVIRRYAELHPAEFARDWPPVPQFAPPISKPRPRAPAATIAAAGLAPAQLETLRLIADGLTNDEIAERRGVASETAKTQSRQVLGKLGAASRAHAVAIGFRTGIIEPTS